MERQMGFGLLTVLLLAVLNSAPAECQVITSYFMVGGNLRLRPPYSKLINNILWKHNGNLLAEWVKGKIDLKYYGSFNGRTTLDENTGYLEIKNMNMADTGPYIVEINSEVQSTSYDVKAIEGVPQPVVFVRPLTCSPALDNCTLTCDGNTVGAEPVTYSWKEGDGEWKQSGKDMNITKTGTAHVETFSCRIKNPVSEKESEAHINPFYQEEEPGNPGVVAGVVIVVFAAIVALAVVIWKREPILKWYHQRRGDNGAGLAAGNGQADTSSKSQSNRTAEDVPLAAGVKPDASETA